MKRTLLCLPVVALVSAALCFAPGAPKILLIYDMEGVSGITRQSFTSASSSDYPEGRKFLTSDVNAAVRGLKDGGAGAIWIQDGHGSGNSQEPDVILEQMDPRATMDFRDREYDPYSTGIDGSITGIVCIGMHARSRTSGFLAHTYTLEPAFRVNGVDINETQLIALSAARWGIPVIMASGDDVLEQQLKTELPDLEYAMVKTAKGRASCEPLAQDEVQRRIEAAAKRAMEKLLAGRLRPYVMAPPYTIEMSFQNAAQTSRVMSDKSIERTGETSIRYTAPTFVEGYEFSKHLISLASADRFSLLVRVVNRHPEGKKIMEEYQKLVLDRWLEPDKLPDWARDQPPPPPRKRFWGDN